MFDQNLLLITEQQHSAKITQELREVRIREGLKAKFEASFAGNPKPDIIWCQKHWPFFSAAADDAAK
jgi:hypothetical protein